MIRVLVTGIADGGCRAGRYFPVRALGGTVDIVERVLGMDDRLMARVAAQAATEGVEVGSIRWSDIHREHLKIMLDAMTPDERLTHRQLSEFGPGSFDLLQTPDLRAPA